MRRGSLLVILLAVVVTAIPLEPAWAQATPANSLTWGDVGENVIELFPTGLAFLTGGFALVGALLFLGGLGRSHTVGQIRGSHPLGGAGHAGWFSPTVSMLVGVGLMFAAAGIYVTKTSLFGPDVKPTPIQGIRQLPQ